MGRGSESESESVETCSAQCCIIGQQTNVDWIRVVLVSLVSNETNTHVRMYT